MLFKLTAVGFQGRMRTGKTRPLLLACANDEGNELDVVVKLSHHMERKVVGLIAETIASMFARDLGLQTPDPYLVALDPKFIATVPDVGAKTALNSSCPVTFGSGLFPPGLSIVAPHLAVPIVLLDQALEIFAFDTLVQNSDRLPSNPNCLTDGLKFTVYDHELAFLFDILGWRPPWQAGALEFWKRGEPHLFYPVLKGKAHNLQRFLTALKAIPAGRCDQYLAALPAQWNSDRGHAERMVDHIRQLRANADAAIAEVLRVLQ